MNLQESIEFVENNIKSCTNLDQLEIAKQMVDTYVLDKFKDLSTTEFNSINSQFKTLIENTQNNLSNHGIDNNSTTRRKSNSEE